MRPYFRRHVLVSILIVFVVSVPAASAQEESQSCKDLNTLEKIYSDYVEHAHFKTAFPCLVSLIKSGKYKKSVKSLNDHMLPVLDHYFTNNLDKEGKYKLDALLWLVLSQAGDESAASNVRKYDWGDQIQPKVTEVVDQFFKPSGIMIKPAKTTLKKNKTAVLSASYINRVKMELKSITKKSPNFKAVVEPKDRATIKVEGDMVYVTSIKAGNRDGTLTVFDKKRNVSGKSDLEFTGRMSKMWPLGGILVTGGLAGAALSSDDDGTSNTLWIITGAAAVITGVLLFEYIQGDGVPLLSKTDKDGTGEALALYLVPGPGTLGLSVMF
jgi:hypothetical protein